ncbi:hypothetical protein PHMEG_00021911, partial [Phytophthora megakarya]
NLVPYLLGLSGMNTRTGLYLLRLGIIPSSNKITFPSRQPRLKVFSTACNTGRSFQALSKCAPLSLLSLKCRNCVIASKRPRFMKRENVPRGMASSSSVAQCLARPSRIGAIARANSSAIT